MIKEMKKKKSFLDNNSKIEETMIMNTIVRKKTKLSKLLKNLWHFSAGLVQTVTLPMQKIACQDTYVTAEDMTSRLSQLLSCLTLVENIVTKRSLITALMENVRSFAIQVAAQHVQ